jgi:hypothetical protein
LSSSVQDFGGATVPAQNAIDISVDCRRVGILGFQSYDSFKPVSRKKINFFKKKDKISAAKTI